MKESPVFIPRRSITAPMKCTACGVSFDGDVEMLDTQCKRFVGTVLLRCEGMLRASPVTAEAFGHMLNREWSPGRAVTPWSWAGPLMDVVTRDGGGTFIAGTIS
jgi:hypothetical protein